MSKRLIQDLHAGISRRDWHAVETAANRLRDDVEKTVAILAGTGVGSLPNDYPLSKLASDSLNPPPQSNVVPCPCTLIEQDEDCSIGYPSLLCGVCKGMGNTTTEQVTALACEMIKIASDMGGPEDPFAAWESIDLIRSQHGRLRAALKPFAAAPYTGPNSFNRAALSDDDFRQARHVLATTEGSDNG